MHSGKGKCCRYPSIHVVLPFLLYALVQGTEHSCAYAPSMQLQQRVQSENSSWLHNMFCAACRHAAGWSRQREARAVEEKAGILECQHLASVYNVGQWQKLLRPGAASWLNCSSGSMHLHTCLEAALHPAVQPCHRCSHAISAAMPSVQPCHQCSISGSIHAASGITPHLDAVTFVNTMCICKSA